MQLTRWATSVGLVLSLGCSSGGGGNTVIDSGITPTNDIPGGTDTPASTDTPATGDGGACAASACGTCTPLAGCGWCARTNRCMAGGGSGSTDMTCMGADWDYVRSDCADYDAGPRPDVPPVVCSTSTTCGACTPRGGCGWCATTNSCVTGTSTGSTDMSCTGAAWQYLPSQCPGFDGGTSCSGIPRTCMLTISGAVRDCTAGQMVTAGCASACGLGSCTGDAVMQICSGSSTAAPCTTALASNDDYDTGTGHPTTCSGDAGADGDLCPAVTFMCPADGHYTIWTGSYNGATTTPATCTPAVR